MQVALTFDPSVTTAPAGFAQAIEAAASFLGAAIKDPITVTLAVGYGECDGTSLAGDTLAEASSDGDLVNYPTLITALTTHATSTADSSFLAGLPTSDPLNGGNYYLSTAQEKALGLVPPGTNGTDGWIGFAATATWDLNPNDGIAPNTTDLFGVALHEMTHALGRVLFSNHPTAFNLMAYGANGQIDLNASDPRYLSLDGGHTNLARFDIASDPGDLAAGSPADPFDAYFQPGTVYAWSTMDMNVMDALGFTVSDLDGFDTTTAQPLAVSGMSYTGPVAALQHACIYSAADNINLTALTPNWFLHSGSGEDAIEVSSGTNVLDGGAGSNFLVGGSGNDTFFIDDRGAMADIWSTVVNFHAGDAVTIFGVTPTDFSLTWSDGQGATGYTGLTLTAAAPGRSNAMLTLAGYTQADLSDGRLHVSFGVEPDGSGPFMYLANR